MFSKKPLKKLYTTQRYGKVDAPAVSEETLEQYHSLYSKSVAGADKISALVLGATPELRDIVLSYGHTLTTVDQDSAALTSKTKQMHYIHHPNEEVLVDNWLAVHFTPTSFDVVLGDGVLTALNQNDQRILLDRIHTWLKPTGYLLLREGAVLHQRPRYAPTVHVHEYRTGQYNLFDLFFGLRLYNNNFKAIDVQTRRTYLKHFHEKLDEYVVQGVLAKQERDQLSAIGAELEHTLLRKEDLEHLLKQLFYPQDVIHDIGSGHLSPWYFFLTQPTGTVSLPAHVPKQRSNYVQAFLAKPLDPNAD